MEPSNLYVGVAMAKPSDTGDCQRNTALRRWVKAGIERLKAPRLL